MSERPPTIDAVAAQRWERMPSERSPWLHEEVGQRMQERLEWINLKPGSWADWRPLRGGLQAHALVARRYPSSECYVLPPQAGSGSTAIKSIAKPWWKQLVRRSRTHFGMPPAGGVGMLWANMALHATADPQALIAQWHQLLDSDGFLMFSCLGPDSLLELRALYGALGWPPPAQAFTDMHDWGDMLVHAGFAEPVMDMERIRLSYSSPEQLLAELRQLGRNLHPQRFAALRGRGWRNTLERELATRLADPASDGRLTLTFEVVYGHALKPAPRIRLEGESAVPLEAMRGMLRRGRPG